MPDIIDCLQGKVVKTDTPDLSEFWCSCEVKTMMKDNIIIEERGHSVDVICGDCAGYLQVG